MGKVGNKWRKSDKMTKIKCRNRKKHSFVKRKRGKNAHEILAILLEIDIMPKKVVNFNKKFRKSVEKCDMMVYNDCAREKDGT